MSSQTKNYVQGLKAAQAGKGKFNEVPKAERTEFYHRSIVLARIFADSKGSWVLKGGTALVWRDPDARSTRDLDFFNREAQNIQQAVEAFERTLQQITTAPYDISLECESNLEQSTVAGHRQSSKITVHLKDDFGHRLKNPITIDLVIGCRMTGNVEEWPTLALEDVLLEEMPKVQLYPVVDHLADKVAATMQTYSQAGRENPSTRVRDLIDIVQLALTEVIDGRQLHEALESERLERGLAPYREGLVCPDSWKTMYTGRKVKRGGTTPSSYKEALVIAKNLIDPAISGEAIGKVWRDQSWT
ncbi:MAG: nucleotidyl transferase AbiEii/AbiGii toxin family protein [Rothia sp. (in: high G+C Gram-positive bacteria)]|uniref:nucleotidyl transferase AbiEii/AbiGii toxin family protein n=1 Tax=Rothia sp. (in: high G+C Gram-positive bacteria) TaxID=1885016 RepID=UPI0026F870F8|nr:nucleotidyl transferase AbiEii/AbiGii toxin family protein [Rothia sp. (in: high G+C Gram-positive bacteria)]